MLTVPLCAWALQDDGDEEDIDFVDDGSTLDEETRKFDRVVGALAGMPPPGCCGIPNSLLGLFFKHLFRV